MRKWRSSLAGVVAMACLSALSGLQAPGQAQAASYHSADFQPPPDGKINLSELLRVIQLYNIGEYACGAAGIEDGFAPGSGVRTCFPHRADYRNGSDWKIDLSELLRVIQFYNIGGYRPDDSGEDGYSPGLWPTVTRTVSGTVRDLSAEGAARLARADLPAVAGARIEVQADLDGDGVFGAAEVFGATSDSRGFFAVSVPVQAAAAKLRVRVSKAGYSEFLRDYADVAEDLLLAPVLAPGEVATIDLSGVAAGPARGGRVALSGDEVVTVRLVKDRATGRRAARVSLGRGEAAGDDTEPVLVSATFPVRGLRLAADAPAQVYASVGYLDTVNTPDLMPGGFRGEGEGDTPVDLLTTYAASQIKLYDASGQELMTDPTDRTKSIHIKMVLPVEAFAALEDEDPATDVVEIPLFYFDEGAGIWKLHKNADGTTAHGWLADNFGNRLTRADLALLQATKVEADATVPDPQYAPVGVNPADITIYGVGEVHHFTTWNCDRSGSSTSFHGDFKDKNGNRINADFRLRNKNGGTTTDRGRPGPDGRINLHTNYDRNADSLIKKLLDRKTTAAERAEILRIIQQGKNPYAKQAVIEALRRYAENLRDDIAGDDSGGDLGRGFRAIFNNKTIQDAFIGSDGLDCTKTPDLCNGILGAAAETVNQSKAGQKAVAVLMQIAVDAYNPGSIDFDYLVNKGVDLLDATVEMEGIKDAKGDMEKVYSGVKKVKALADKVKEARKNRFTNWNAYWDAAKEFKEALSAVKDVATTIGGRAGRVAGRRLNLSVIAPPEPPTDTDADREGAAAWIEREILLEGEDVGGVFFGASPLNRYGWGHYGATGFVPVTGQGGRPRAGGSLAVLEIFDGTDWVPVPGASDRGVRADFIPIPAMTSFGGGSPGRPVVHLGTWTFDLDPNVEVTGTLMIQGTDPARPARNAVAVVEGQEFRPDENGAVAGAMAALVASVSVAVPGAYWGSKPVASGRVDLGTIQVPEAILWDPARSSYQVQRGAALTIDPGARSVSGDPVLYTFRRYRSFWAKYYGEAPLDEVADAASYPFPTDQVGQYWMDVVGAVNSVSSAVGSYVTVRNNPPVIQAVTVVPASPKVGDELRIGVTATDDDGEDDIGWRGVSAWCVDQAGARYGLWAVQQDGEWVARTAQQFELYRAPGESLTCTVAASVSDRLGGSATKEHTFTLTQNQVAPEVARQYLAAEYTLGCWRYAPEGPCELSTRPGHAVSFLDRNGDLDRYELDCGAGGDPVISADPITEACRYTQPGDYVVTYAAVDQGERRTEVSTTIHVLYPLRLTIAYPEGLVATQEDGFDLVDLPATGATDRTLTMTTLSDNGAGGYDEDNGVIRNSHYSLTYRAGNTWWGQRLGSGSLPAGGVTVPLTKPGTYELWVSADDDRGMAAAFSRVFKVTAPFDVDLEVNGKTPKVHATSARPWFMAGDSVTFGAVDLLIPEGVGAWDPRFVWTLDDAETSAARSFSQSLPAGTHTVKLVARNAVDAVVREVVREVTVTVHEDLTVGFTPSYQERVLGEVSLGDRYDLGLALAAGENIQGAYWSVTKLVGGVAVVSTKHTVIEGSDFTTRSYVFAEAGTYRITATVWDDRGVLTTRSFGTDLVVKAYPPQITSLAADKTTVRPGGSATVTAVVTDPDARAGEVLAYQWYVNGTFVRSTTAPTFTHAFVQEGTHRVTLVAYDASNQSATETVTVAAQYTPPSIQEVRVDQASGPALLTVNFTAVATDPDGTITGYAWDVGADGTIEGTQATFQHVFGIGTHTVRLTVTDNDGKTAQATRTIYARDPDAATVNFEFKELRSNGFGPAYDFTPQDFYHHGEGLTALAYAPVDDVNVRPENLTEPAPTLVFPDLGFYGSDGASWGNPSTLLFQVTAPGTYPVGMRSMSELAERVVSFPDTYACGYLLYSDWSQPFGVYQVESRAEYPIRPPAASVTTDGVVKVLALLGNEVVPSTSSQRCVPTYYGFVTGAGASLTLTETTAIPLAAAPEGYALQAVTFDVGDGIEFTLWNTDLDRDGSERHLIPIIPTGSYSFRYNRQINGRSWQFAFPVQASAVAVATEIVLDFGLVQDRDDLTVANTVAGDYLTLTWQGPAAKVSGTIHTSGSVGPVGSVPALSGAGATVAMQYWGGGANLGFFRKGAVADLAPNLDLGTPGVETTIEKLELSVDPTAKTLTVDFGSTAGHACFVTVDASYHDPGLTSYQYRNRSWSFATDGSKTSYILEYAIPETSFAYPGGGFTEVYPAIDALTEVTAAVTCGRTGLGYEGLLRELLADVNFSYVDHASLTDSGALQETLRRSVTWQKP